MQPIRQTPIALFLTFFLTATITTPAISQSAPEAQAAIGQKSDAVDPSIEQWLLSKRIIRLTSEINLQEANRVITQLRYLDDRNPGKDIYLYINSGGGRVTQGMAIYDTIRQLKSPVVTIAEGQAYSMAAVLLAAGAKGKRCALANARIMIHQPWLGSAGGPASDVEIQARELLNDKRRLNEVLAHYTGQPLKKIETDTDRDFFMSAQEAKQYGLIDCVLDGSQ